MKTFVALTSRLAAVVSQREGVKYPTICDY